MNENRIAKDLLMVAKGLVSVDLEERLEDARSAAKRVLGNGKKLLDQVDKIDKELDVIMNELEAVSGLTEDRMQEFQVGEDLKKLYMAMDTINKVRSQMKNFDYLMKRVEKGIS